MKKYLLSLWLLLGIVSLAVAQQRQVTGVVRSADKAEALPGVTVVEVGTTNGATTDGEGRFVLTVAGPAAKIRLSYIGFVSQDVTVGTRSSITVELREDSKALDDVVVIGYQAVQRRDVTGSVSSVSAQQIKDIPVNSAADALAGRLAGVQVTASEGQPGSDVRIRVRGGGSITQDNSPLYVVDGVQVENALSVLSPQDIASVDVLKDASATAIYGARGANGVVIITTKNGREGKTTVSYTGFAGVRTITKTLDVLNPAEYLDYAYERSALSGASYLSGFRTRFGSSNFTSDTLNLLRNSPFLDWQDRVFGRRAFQQTHNLTVSGGSKSTTYSISLTDNEEKGIQYGSDYNRKLVNFRFDHKATDKFRIGFNTRFNNQVVKGSGTSTNGATTTSRLRNAVTYVPLETTGTTAINPADLIFDDDLYNNSGQLVNPILAIDNEYRQDKRLLINLSGYASYNFTKTLQFRSTVGYDNTNRRIESFNGQFSPSIRSSNYANLPFASIATSVLGTINNSNVLTYSLTKGKHAFDALLGEEIYQQLQTSQNIQTNFLPLEITADKAINNINQGVPPTGYTQPYPSTDQPINSRLLSGFGRLNYSYDDKYLLTFTFRADGSSKFAPGRNRVGYFPAASAAWRISRESFMQNYTSTISDLKLRLSYGLAGNNRIGDGLYFSSFTPGNAQYALGGIVLPATSATSLANPNLKWETTASSNAGLDLSLFNNRVQLTADVYYNKTRDLLINLSIPSSSGYPSQLVNVGATSNRGLELQATATAVQTKNFTWTTSANMSFNRGRVESLGPLQALPPQYSGWASTAISSDYLVRVGQPVGLMYGYVTDGWYTTDQFEGYTNGRWVPRNDVASDQGVIGAAIAPGSLRLKDLNKDGVVNEQDRTVIGNANPKFTGGLNQQFSYKNFDASIFLNFVYGNDVYNANKIEFTSFLAQNTQSNGLGILADRYRTIDASGQNITDLATLDAVNQNAKIWSPPRQLLAHSWAIEDGSFLRINNVTLGYTLPKALVERAKLTQLRFYVTLNNLYTFTKYSGYDPEVNTRRATPLTPGVDYAAYPRSRAFLFGVNLSL
ncbi:MULTISPECIES: SusC/RagA family TonB-linked outer membrane protein [Hymenobacter]|uniref:TonB-dependent receptor n=1 Tax=Hymenobacter profundi TaxID=1982110 RepID=A0ABS6X1L4_9BACT|nr:MULTISPECIES: TonB-dependent receptor [Hymenobacter]MBW3129392.1 TonB-dependent receptor [Hymenobacter profundi]QNE39560.1 TonB-dependent receptor [Hymenobacter sp. NBH84]